MFSSASKIDWSLLGLAYATIALDGRHVQNLCPMAGGSRTERLWRLNAKVAGSKTLTAGYLRHLASLCWPRNNSWKIMCTFVSLIKKVNNKKKDVWCLFGSEGQKCRQPNYKVTVDKPSSGWRYRIWGPIPDLTVVFYTWWLRYDNAP